MSKPALPYNNRYRRNTRLVNMANILSELSFLYNSVRVGDISADVMPVKELHAMIRTAGALIASAELERRQDELEKRLTSPRKLEVVDAD